MLSLIDYLSNRNQILDNESVKTLWPVPLSHARLLLQLGSVFGIEAHR